MPAKADGGQAPAPAAPPLAADHAIAPMVDVRCAVEFILGSTAISVRNCLGLAPHSVVRLQQSAGSDLQVRVHGINLASGEVVIVDDNSALRISRMSPPSGVESA